MSSRKLQNFRFYSEDDLDRTESQHSIESSSSSRIRHVHYEQTASGVTRQRSVLSLEQGHVPSAGNPLDPYIESDYSTVSIFTELHPLVKKFDSLAFLDPNYVEQPEINLTSPTREQHSHRLRSDAPLWAWATYEQENFLHYLLQHDCCRSALDAAS
ncbi:hypothetical protein VKT23_019301 [Stygiomarasmius scandens]|uniref:Uncharacterized protein n=1 Tax=Marasmiellus scandens TaxID=2682957 RepID=A0ABR1IR39_9AGAR